MFIDCIEIQFLSHVIKIMSETKRRKGKCSPGKGSLSVVRIVPTNTVRGKDAELPLRVARLNKRSTVPRISDIFQMVLSFARLNTFLLKDKNQLDATSRCITLTICSTCFGQFYAHHQELTTTVLITTYAVRFLISGFWISVRAAVYNLQPGHLSSLPAPNFQPTATQESDGICGNQHYSRELLMMGIELPETC